MLNKRNDSAAEEATLDYFMRRASREYGSLSHALVQFQTLIKKVESQ